MSSGKWGPFVSASSVKPIVSELFCRDPIGNSLQMFRLWLRTEQMPSHSLNQWWPDTTYANMSEGLELCKKNPSSKAHYVNTFSYIYTNISHPQGPHTSNVHLWIDNVHLFSACTEKSWQLHRPLLRHSVSFAHGYKRCDWSAALGRCLLWSRTESNIFFNTLFLFMHILAWNYLLREQKCAEKYLFYWYAIFFSNMLVTDNDNAQSLNSGCITSNAISPISFLMRYRNFKWIQLKSCCRYPYDSLFKLKYIMCTSKPSLGLSIFGLHYDLK